jgi:hypothetical protein
MPKNDWRTRFHERIDELGRDIRRMRDQLSSRTHHRSSGDADGLAAIEGRHADLHNRLKSFGETAPEKDVVDTLEADFDGLMQSIGDWIVRQDAKAARR